MSDRYYRAYLESLKGANNCSLLSKEDFWALKQNRVTDFEIGLLSGLGINESKYAADLRRNLTFKDEFLQQDKLFSDVTKVFEYLKSQKITFCIATLRRRKHLFHAIKQFKLNKYLDEHNVFSVTDSHKISNDIQEKYIMLVSALNKLELLPNETWFIGDTDTDVHAARLAKLNKVIAISRGLRSKEQLQLLKPDYIVSGLEEVVGILKQTLVHR